MRWAELAARIGGVRNAYEILPEGVRPLGRCVRRLENNIRTDRLMNWVDVSWDHLAQDNDHWVL
jgi:hypothetical protein